MSADLIAHEVSARALLFGAEMVAAILDGRKTQTRRVVTGRMALEWLAPNMFTPGYVALRENGLSPYGYAGDMVVFLCTWAAPAEYDAVKPTDLPRDVRTWSLFDGTPKPEWCGKNRPGRFMPRWMRPRMPMGELVEVRVERVQEISEADARAEGVERMAEPEDCTDEDHYLNADCGYFPPRSYLAGFRATWDALNKARGYGWDANPYVWALTFRVVEHA